MAKVREVTRRARQLAINSREELNFCSMCVWFKVK
jgi:hypothetical protein